MRYAVFVDAGYLFAQGSVAIASNVIKRDDISLDAVAAKQKVLDTADRRVNGTSLLRIYWYDGMIGGRLTSAQQEVASLEDVKLRLGIVNQYGQQKGVDSLIITDIVELARNHAISDAVILSGDEDLRVCVQIAQSYGVRVHLVGIAPSRGSQSIALLQEADTLTEMGKDDVEAFMSLPTVSVNSNGATGGAEAPTITSGTRTVDERSGVPGFVVVPSYPMQDWDDPVMLLVLSLSSEELEEIAKLDNSAFIPRKYDAKLMAIASKWIGRRLDAEEMALLRKKFRERAKFDATP